MPSGRLPIFEKPEDLEKKINEYLASKKETKEPISMVGFCGYADIHKDTLFEYAKKELFSDSVKKLKNEAEIYMRDSGLQNKVNPTMAIFLLKNDYGYKDKTEFSGDAQSPLTIVSHIPTKK